MDKEQQAKLLTEIVETNQKNGLYEGYIGDTNKMVTMKLYTEEQVRKQMEVLEDIIDLWDNGLPLDSHTLKKCKYALENLTPIELPSDEEIDEESPYVPNDASIDFWSHKEGFVDGAKWMRDKILNKYLWHKK